MYFDLLKHLSEKGIEGGIGKHAEDVVDNHNWNDFTHHGDEDFSKQDDSKKHLAAHVRVGSEVDATITVDKK